MGAATARVDGFTFEVRPACAADDALIFSTWLKGAKVGCYENKRIRDAVYYRRRHTLIERIMARGVTLVAHLPGDPDTILGYVVAEPTRSPPVLHYAFTKMPFRRLGIASRLIEAVIPDPNQARYTCMTIWTLAVPAPQGVNRADRRAIQAARFDAVKGAITRGEDGGDAEDLVRKYPGLTYDPDARWEED